MKIYHRKRKNIDLWVCFGVEKAHGELPCSGNCIRKKKPKDLGHCCSWMPTGWAKFIPMKPIPK